MSSQWYIKILKEENIEPLIYSYKDLFIESLKCHDNDISNYIKNQINDDDDDTINKKIFCSCLEFHNFIELFELIDKIGFNSFDKFKTLEKFIEYDYTIITKLFLNH